MPFHWTPTSERQMLLLAITKANLKPTSETWIAVASLLGNGITPSAVSQKFYKLRAECAPSNGVSHTSSAQSTPKKRKRPSQPAVVKPEYETDEIVEISMAPIRLISDRPFNKMHEELVEENPVKKQKLKQEAIKRESLDGDNDNNYVAWLDQDQKLGRERLIISDQHGGVGAESLLDCFEIISG